MPCVMRSWPEFTHHLQFAQATGHPRRRQARIQKFPIPTKPEWATVVPVEKSSNDLVFLF